MDPLTLPFRLPLLPLQAVIKLGEVIEDEAERQLHDPARVRRQLEEVEEARVHGEVSDEDVARAEQEAAGRLVRPVGRRRPGRDDEGS